MVQVMETLQDYAPMFTRNTEGNLICTCVYHIIAFFTFHPLLSRAKILSCKFFLSHANDIRQSSPNGRINITGQSRENIWLYMSLDAEVYMIIDFFQVIQVIT